MRLQGLPSEEFEGAPAILGKGEALHAPSSCGRCCTLIWQVLHPVFEEDEWKLIAVGDLHNRARRGS